MSELVEVPAVGELWDLRRGGWAKVVETHAPGPFPVIAWTPWRGSYRMIYARLDGTANARPGVPDEDDLIAPNVVMQQ